MPGTFRIDGEEIPTGGGAVSELEKDGAGETEALLNYYKKWHSSNELYHLTMAGLKSRQFVINSLGYRGYGVNRDLLKALDYLADRYGGLRRSLTERFYGKVKAVEEKLFPTGEIYDQRRSDRIIAELARKLGKSPDGDMPQGGQEVALDLDHYFRVMSQRDIVACQYGDLPEDVLLRGIVLHDHHEGKRRALRPQVQPGIEAPGEQELSRHGPGAVLRASRTSQRSGSIF